MSDEIANLILGIVLGAVLMFALAMTGAFWTAGVERRQTIRSLKVCRERIVYFQKVEAELVKEMQDSIEGKEEE